MSAYVHLLPSTSSPCLMRDRGGVPSWVCPRCEGVLPATGPIDVEIDEGDPGRGDLTFVVPFCLGLIRRELLDVLGAGVEKELFLGKVTGPDGVIDGWATYRARRSVIVRGRDHATSRRCPACSRVIYSAIESEHLFPAPPQDAAAFESQYGALVVRQDAALRAALRQRRGLDLLPLDVLPAPLDGLGDLTGPARGPARR